MRAVHIVKRRPGERDILEMRRSQIDIFETRLGEIDVDETRAAEVRMEKRGIVGITIFGFHDLARALATVAPKLSNVSLPAGASRFSSQANA